MSRAQDPRVSALDAIAERMLEGIGDLDVARQLQGEVNRLRNGARALDSVDANRSPIDTPAAHTLKVARLARKFDSEITSSLTRSIKLWVQAKQAVQRRIEDKINLKQDSFAPEIRATFRSLSGNAQKKLLTELVEQNRGPELAAILLAPASLTGLTASQREGYEKAMFSRHAASELAEMDQLDTVYDAFNTAQKAAGELTRSFIDPAKLAEIERGAAAADAASDAFNQTVQ